MSIITEKVVEDVNIIYFYRSIDSSTYLVEYERKEFEDILSKPPDYCKKVIFVFEKNSHVTPEIIGYLVYLYRFIVLDNRGSLRVVTNDRALELIKISKLDFLKHFDSEQDALDSFNK